MLRLQLSLVVIGAATWYAGAFFDQDFVSGIGVGIMIGALALRLLHRE